VIVLGVSGVLGHDAAACLLRDGELVAFAEEERFTREKHAPGSFPLASTTYCLRAAGIQPGDVDVLAASWDPALNPTAGYLASWLARFQAHPVWAQHRPAAAYVPHHLAHAASAAYFEARGDAAVLVVDGNGENVSTTIGRLDDRGFRVLEEYPVSQSLGHFYKRASFYLGLGAHGEGKLMGLAAYGTPHADVDVISVHRDGYSVRLDVSDDLPIDQGLPRLAAAWDQWFRARFGPPVPVEWAWDADAWRLEVGAPTVLDRADVAASVQRTLVEVIVQLARRATELAGSRTLILSGGVALNCGANGAILDRGAAAELVLFPACHDAGGALGAAAWAAREGGDRWVPPRADPYLGPTMTSAAVHRILDRFGLASAALEDPTVEAARLIGEGRVIAWCRGRMEAGPRALGNRSILARVDDADVAARVNRVKLREAWRPLGPSVALRAADTLFDRPVASPYMLLFRSVRDAARERLIGTTHVDGTTRPQTVTPESNADFYRLLRAVGELTGTPAVINTSFNVGPEPIACTPLDAIRTFVTSEIDALFLDDFVLHKAPT